MNQQIGIEEIDRVAPPKAAGGDNVVRRQATIMLVDDESITLDTLQIFLEDAGYQRFVLTSDAREAIPRSSASARTSCCSIS